MADVQKTTNNTTTTNNVANPSIGAGQIGRVISAGSIIDVVKNRIIERERVKFYNAIITGLANQGKKISTDLHNQILELQKKLEKISEDAKILKDIELGQVEEAIKRTLEKLDSVELFETLCINVNGKTVKLVDFVKKLIEFDSLEPLETQFIYDTNNNLLGVEFTLVNGKKVNIPVKVTEKYNKDSGLLEEVLIKGETDKWLEGLTVGFESLLKVFYKDVEDPVTGEKYKEPDIREEYRKDFFLKVNIEPCTPLTPETATPDLNKDGKIGT
jgi:hypothetical protein